MKLRRHGEAKAEAAVTLEVPNWHHMFKVTNCDLKNREAGIVDNNR